MTPGLEKKHTLNFEAEQEGPRYTIKIDGKHVAMTSTSFRYLLVLAWSKVVVKGGWMSKDHLDKITVNHAMYFYRMQNEIMEGVGNKPLAGWWPLYESDRMGNYRLTGNPEIDFNFESLLQFPDHGIRVLVEDIARRLARRMG